MGMDPFVVFPAEWAAAGFEIHATPPTLPFPSGYKKVHVHSLKLKCVGT